MCLTKHSLKITDALQAVAGINKESSTKVE